MIYEIVRPLNLCTFPHLKHQEIRCAQTVQTNISRYSWKSWYDSPATNKFFYICVCPKLLKIYGHIFLGTLSYILKMGEINS